MIGFYFLAQFLGYMTPVPGQVTATTEDEGMWASKPYVYYSCAGAMLLLGLLDIAAFQFNPMQKNIFLDQEKGSHYFNKSAQDPFEIEAYEGDRSESRASAFSPYVVMSGGRFSRSVTSEQAPLIGKKVIDKDMFDHLNQIRPKKTVYEIVYEQ